MKYRSVLDACAELLLEKEKIGREEFEALFPSDRNRNLKNTVQNTQN